jgi:hypothetical protein
MVKSLQKVYTPSQASSSRTALSVGHGSRFNPIRVDSSGQSSTYISLVILADRCPLKILSLLVSILTYVEMGDHY